MELHFVMGCLVAFPHKQYENKEWPDKERCEIFVVFDLWELVEYDGCAEA